MKTLSDIPDCYGPMPEFFLDANTGGLVTATCCVSAPLIWRELGAQEAVHLLENRIFNAHWIENAFPARCLHAAFFFEN